MSGPKSSSVSLVSEEQFRLERERRRKAMLKNCERLEGEIAKLREQANALVEQIAQEGGHEAAVVAEVPLLTGEDDWTLAIHEQELKRTEAALNMRNRALREKLAALKWENGVVKAVEASLSSLSTEAVVFGRKKVDANAATDSGLAPERQEADLLLSQKKTLGAIANIDDEARREEYAFRFEAIGAEADKQIREKQLLGLKTEVFRCLEAQDLRRLAKDALCKVADPSAPMAQEAWSAVQRVTDRASLDKALALVDAAVSAEVAAGETAYVERVVREALESLGYAVGEDIEVTDFGTVALAESALVPHHALRVQLDARGGRMYTRVVSDGTTTAAEDVRAEQETCSAVFEIVRQLEEHGVRAEFRSEREPGAVAVEVDKRLERARRASRRQAARGRMTQERRAR